MQFSILFDAAASPNLASLSASEQQAVLDTANAAATIWSWYLTPANVTLDLTLIVDDSLFSGNTLAEGGPEVFYSTGATFGGERVYESDTAIELRTGRDKNGSAPDLQIGFTVNSIRNLLTFKTDDTAVVVRNRSDALSVFLHEIEHGLGFSSFDDDTSAASVYDTFIQNGNFIGANAEAAANAPTGIPLEPGSFSHIAESGSFGADLMSPLISQGINIHISALDLAILQDIGVPIRQASGGADVMHALYGVPLHLGGGNDTGYAVADGSMIYGEDGDDQLYGGKRNDFFYGGNGNDYLEGGAGNDVIEGGPGQDRAGFSGIYASYIIVDSGAGNLTVTGPDGVDTLASVEQLVFSDRIYNVSNGSTSGNTRSDFDGDGKADILWQNDSGQAAVWLMDGTNLAGSGLAGSNPGPTWHVKGAGDFDGDGKADILWQNDSGQAALWTMNGTNLLNGGPIGSNPGPTWHVTSAGDFDVDGKADILWQNDSGQASVWLMSGPNLTSSGLVGGNPGPSWHVKGAGDFDGDGKSDVLWQNDSGQAAIWTMNGTNLLGGGPVGSNPGPTWHVVGAGDFDADGKADILWQNDSGQAAIWLMNGTNLTGSGLVGGNPGPTWHVVGATDINSDGKSDILWQNDSGLATAWLTSGTSILSTANLGSNPGSTWHMIAR
jgi:hypothetical protein